MLKQLTSNINSEIEHLSQFHGSSDLDNQSLLVNSSVIEEQIFNQIASSSDLKTISPVAKMRQAASNINRNGSGNSRRVKRVGPKYGTRSLLKEKPGSIGISSPQHPDSDLPPLRQHQTRLHTTLSKSFNRNLRQQSFTR